MRKLRVVFGRVVMRVAVTRAAVRRVVRSTHLPAEFIVVHG